jgi:hypothetical protein
MKTNLLTTKLTALLVLYFIHSASALDVNFTATYNVHGAISTWDGNFSNATMNTRPDILPFMSSATNAARYGGNHPLNLLGGGTIIAGIFTMLDGAGTTGLTTVAGSTSAFGGSFGNFSIQTYSTGARLPTAGATGVLGSTLSLPNGLSLSAGTQVFADYYSYVLDYDDPASYWYDSTSELQHQVYQGGFMDFYYKDNLDQFHLFARYEDAVVSATVDYVNNVDAWDWTGNNVAVDNVLLPTGISFSNNIALNNSGVILTELDTSPYVGFFSSRTRSFTASFDTDNATLVPEPSSLVLLLMGTLPLLRRRRARDCSHLPGNGVRKRGQEAKSDNF